MACWHVGMKVVCIREWDHTPGNACPQVGAVYTIRAIEVCDEGTGDLFLQFHEIINPQCWWPNGYGELSFWEGGFRPVVKRKTDISIFTAMLNPADDLVGA